MQAPGPNYDYVLVVGPGRSGTTFLYENLKLHPGFAFPEIKEAGYYRSLRRFCRGRERLREGEAGGILADVSNLAYKDRALGEGVSRLKRHGVRVLLVVLLRDHLERARSIFRYRRSRGHLSAWLGAERLERAVMRDRLTAAQLDAIYRIGVDVLAIEFAALTEEPREALRVLGELCGVGGGGDVGEAGKAGGAAGAAVPERAGRRLANESVRPRSRLLVTMATVAAGALRALGFRRLLQRLKDSRRLQRLFFAPMSGDERRVALKHGNVRLLEEAFAECLATVRERSTPLAGGVHLRRAGG